MKALLVAVLAAVLGNAPAPVVETFDRGETLDYTLTWLKVTGGTARMTIGPVDGDASKLRITSIGKSGRGFSRIFRVRDHIESIVDRNTFSTEHYRKRLDEKGDTKDELTVITAEGDVTRSKATWTRPRHFKVPTPILDPFSVIYYMRTVDLSPGKKYELQLIADGKLYMVHARVVKRETVTTEAGTFRTVMVEPRMEAGGVDRDEKLYVWYTDDDRRIPVRIRTEIKVGSITASLRAVSPGVTSIEPPVVRGQ